MPWYEIKRGPDLSSLSYALCNRIGRALKEPAYHALFKLEGRDSRNQDIELDVQVDSIEYTKLDCVRLKGLAHIKNPGGSVDWVVFEADYDTANRNGNCFLEIDLSKTVNIS